MSIFNREGMRKLYDNHYKDGMTHTTGLAECFTWHNVCVVFASDYPHDQVFVEIDGKPAEEYFDIDVNGDMLLCEAEKIFWETPEYVEKAEHMFLGTYKEE